MFDALGVEKAKALMGFHAFTGSDTTGRFAGKSKGTCFKTFTSASDNVLLALASLGTKEALPSLDITEALEEFVCRIYSPRTTHKKTSDLRWHMFSQKHCEGERLPPTLGSLEPHIWRAHYVAIIWKRAGEPQPQLPSAVDYGWTEIEGALCPMLSLKPSAPKSILLLIKCTCQKGCSTKRCSCAHANMPCTELCGWSESDECQNTEDSINISDLGGIDNEDSDSDDD